MDVLKAFDELGTRLLKKPEVLHRQLGQVRGLLFDWDGVFNEGWKDAQGGSPFSEVGSMGVNLLRFALWQRDQRMLPCAIITGQHNPQAEAFAQREHLDAIYMGYTHKPEALEHFLDRHGLRADQVAFFYDDVLDIPLARHCGLRILIGRPAGPLFQAHVTGHGDADIITACSGGEHGLREACELLITLIGRGPETLEHRIRHDVTYTSYLAERGAISTDVQRRTR